MSSISRIFRIFSKPYQQNNQRKLSLLALEDRVVPAVTAFYNQTASSLTINLQSSNDVATVVYNTSSSSYSINSSGNSITILGGYSASNTVDRLIIQDTGDGASGQSVSLSASSGSISLADGLITTGVESVTISSAVDGVSSNGISFVGASTKIQLAANLTTQDQPISFGGPVLLAANVNLLSKDSSGGTITFSSTINTVTALAAKSLTIDAGTEGVSFGNSLGATNSLNVVSITASTVSLAGNITAAGNITVDAPLTLSRPVTISTTGTAILFKGTIDSDSTSSPRALTIGLSGQGGTTEFQDELGGTNPLGAVTVNRTGAITIKKDITTVNAAVAFKGAVILLGDSIITTKTGSGSGANVSFSGSVNATASGAQKLTVEAGSAGAVTFGAAVGTTALGDTDISGKTIALAGDLSSRNGDITITGAVTLNGNATLSSANGNITLNGSVNGSSIGNKSLTINAGAGDVSVNADVGNLRALNLFSITGCNDATISKTVKASTVSILSDDDTDPTDPPSITIAGTASITGATSLTMSKKDGVIEVSGRFYGTVTVVGENTTKGNSAHTTTLKATSNSNFSVTGTDVADRSKGTLVKTQPGKSATITFSNINALDLTGGSSGNVFTLTEWFYDAEIDGSTGSDSIVVNRAQDATSGLDFVLDATSGVDIIAPAGSFGPHLTPANWSSPESINYTITDIEAASLSGGAGNDSFDIGGWNAKASVIGNSGIDDLIWSGTADSLLTPTSFSAGLLVASLSSINSASLTNTSANSKFAISGFVGGVDITGISSSTVTATYNSNYSLVGTGATAGTITTGNTTIDFTAGNVSLIGGARDNVFTLDGTYLGTVTLDGGSGNDTYNITLPASSATKNVTVSDTGPSTRDAIIARSITSAGLLSKNSTQIYYTTATVLNPGPRINFSGIEFFTLQ